MAKGGYNQRRIEQKKMAERARRKRERRRRKMITWAIGFTVLSLLALAAVPRGDNRFGVAFFSRTGFLGGGDSDSLANPTPTPTSTSTAAPCTPPAGVKKSYASAPAMSIDTKKTYTATFTTTAGTMTVELFDNAAPKTVNNFVFLARTRYYDCSPFHRVLPNFGGPGSDMIQGGDPVNRNGTGGPGYQFGDENMIPFDKPGYLAMANAGPGSNGSQFFFLSGRVSHLNRKGTCPGQGCHSVFGTVKSGLDVINKIASVPLADPQGGTPVNAPTLLSVKIAER